MKERRVKDDNKEANRFLQAADKGGAGFSYSGKSPVMTFEAFDECVISWARNKYGERFGKAL